MAAISTRGAFLRSHRSAILRIAGFVVAIAVLITVAIVAQGFDVKQTPLKSTAIWALNKSTSETGTSRYARIDTTLREVDTVKSAADASSIVQGAASVVLMTNNDGKYVDIDQANPPVLKADSKDLASAPSGTPKQVVTTDDHVGYLTDGGAIYVASLDSSGMSAPVAVDPYSDQTSANGKRDAYVSNRIAISSDGVLYSYSSKKGSVVAYDLDTGKRVSDDTITVPGAVVDSLQLTVVDGTWALYNGSSRMWTARALDGFAVTIAGTPDLVPLLQQPSATGSEVYLATTGGLYTVPLSGGVTGSAFSATGLGSPAVPTALDGVMYAAWLPASASTGGTLFSSAKKGTRRALPFGTQSSVAAPEPVFRVNGGSMILNDDASGWVWTVPDATLVPSSQNWAAGESQSPESDPTQETAQDVVEPKPPRAVDDTFGVRAGSLVTLPVLLNDSDPNASDVLTVVPESVEGLADAFGTLTTTTNNQRIAVRVADGAKGTASFSYQVTDGVSKDSPSSHATVTLSVVADDTETAPLWCGDSANGCTQTWPSLEVAPGGSGSVTVLDQWVDAEGDAEYLQSVTKTNPDDRGDVGVTQDGRVFFQDDNAGDDTGAQVPLTVTVADDRGKSTAKALLVRVTPQPTLTAAPLAVTTHVGQPLSIDPSPYISGVGGVYTVTQAVPSDSAAVVSPDAAGTGIDFSAQKPGVVVVRYDLSDTAGQVASSVARVTVLADDKATLTTAPITVFVRPGLDSTVDVFSAVSNPADKLLILSTAVAQPATAANGVNALTADVVGHGLLRVTGSTSDGQSGLIGQVQYVVTDGGSAPGSSVQGVATIVLLPPQAALAPIAVDDSVTARAGAQLDIPVLTNDVSVDGGSMVLNPEATTLTNSSASAGGLAFVSGSLVRFLAPSQPGSYTITYQVYAAGAPTKFGTGTVQVTVTRQGENQSPRPKPLQARAAAGQSVSIPFDGYGIDPDGDSVILDRIASQPEHGTASISARGDEITYSAFADASGTDSFTYQVKDPDGKTGVSTVTVGVIGADTASTPITFTDYVEVQEGDTNRVEVRPASNDVDPLAKPLTVTAVTPFATAGTPEFAALDGLISKGADGSPVSDNTVTIAAGSGLGTKTFQYTVSDGLNLAVGYIVLNVVSSSVPDVPRVTDSYVSIDDRDSFPTDGLDVVSGKVTWLSGNVSGLTLSLVDPPTGYVQNGLKISGPLPTGASVLVTFKVTGVSAITKKNVSSYGFLRVPGPEDIIVALRTGVKPVSVKENGKPVTIALADYVSLPAGTTLDVDASAVAAVKRVAAKCASSAPGTISYTPNAGAPFTDACLVPVKLDFQKTYTALLIPIAVVPEKPVPSFNSASLSGLLPGISSDVHTLDLTTMVAWDGPQDNANLAFTIDKPDPSKFTTTMEGTTLSVRAKGGVPGGTRAVVGVHFAGSYASVTSVGVVNLTTSAPPPSFPKGGSTSVTCRITDGSCPAVNVIGLKGESNELKDGKLTVVSSVGDSACPGISFAVVGSSSIKASWSGFPDGLACQTSFVVKDVNGFQSSLERNGTIHWSFEGLPRAPASVHQTAYGDERITLAIDPGKATDAYPALARFVVRQDDNKKVVAVCGPNGACPDITGLTNLEHHRFSAYAVNSTGEESQQSATTEAWSFAKPSLGTVSADPAYDPSWTDPKRGLARIEITGSEGSVTGYRITGADATVPRTGDSTTVQLAYKVGSASIKITPVTSSDPPQANGPTTADAENSYTVKIASVPGISDYSATATANSVTFAKLSVDRNNSDRPSKTLYGVYKFAAPACAVDASGGNLQMGGGDATISDQPTIGNLESNETYRLIACTTNGFGLAVSKTETAFTASTPQQPPAITYHVAAAPVQSSPSGAALYKLTLDNEAAAGTTGDPKTEARWTNWSTSSHSTDQTNTDPQISVVWCLKQAPIDLCGNRSTATAAAGSATQQISVQGNTYTGMTCTKGGTLTGEAVSFTGHGAVSITSFRYHHPNADNADEVVTVANSAAVPADATSVDTVTAKLAWAAGDPTVAGLNDYQWTIASATQSITCH